MTTLAFSGMFSRTIGIRWFRKLPVPNAKTNLLSLNLSSWKKYEHGVREVVTVRKMQFNIRKCWRRSNLDRNSIREAFSHRINSRSGGEASEKYAKRWNVAAHCRFFPWMARNCTRNLMKKVLFFEERILHCLADNFSPENFVKISSQRLLPEKFQFSGKFQPHALRVSSFISAI